MVGTSSKTDEIKIVTRARGFAKFYSIMEEMEEVCLSCLKWFERSGNEQLDEVYQRFLTFAKDYLQCSPRTVPTLYKALKGDVEGRGRTPIFCKDCEHIVTIVCNLFDGLCEVKSKLSQQISLLGNILEKKSSSNEDMWTNVLLRALAEQLKVDGGKERVSELRNELAEKCKLKSQDKSKQDFDLPKLNTLPKQISVIPIPPPIPTQEEIVRKALEIPMKAVQLRPHLIPCNRNNYIGNPQVRKPSPPVKKPEKGMYSTASPVNRSGGQQEVTVKKRKIAVARKNTVPKSGPDRTAAIKETIQAKLPIDVEVVEDDGEDDAQYNIKSEYSPPSMKRRAKDEIQIFDVPYQNITNNDEKQEFFDESDVNGEYANSTGELVDVDDSSNSSSYMRNFTLKPNETIIINQNQPNTFIDESENFDYMEPSSQDDSQDGMPLPLDVTIEEMDNDYLGIQEYLDQPSPNSSLGNIRIVDVSGGPSTAKKTKRVRHLNKDVNKLSKVDGNVPTDIPGFVDYFKNRRRELNMTQGDVAKSLGCMYGVTQEELFSQTTVSRFEAMNLTEKNMEKLVPLFRKWILEVDPANPMAVINSNGTKPIPESSSAVKIEKRKKRTNIEKEALDYLENYYQQNARPTSEELVMISETLKLEREVVRVWFCNRRQKSKRTSDTYFPVQQDSYSMEIVNQLIAPSPIVVYPAVQISQPVTVSIQPTNEVAVEQLKMELPAAETYTNEYY